METISHVLETPNGMTLIGAETFPQLETTAMEEFFKIFPEELIESYNRQKKILKTKNNHTILFRPLDEEQKARSLNLTFFWIEEANGVGYSYFNQLRTRLRNHATEHHRGILSTNPDMNWVKTEFLLRSKYIYNSDIEYPQDPDKIIDNYSTHIAPTHLNTYLPPNFYEDTAEGQPEWWINRYLNASFENREGLVFPMYLDHIVSSFSVPNHWKRRIGGDFGLNNPTGFLSLATDPSTGITYVYKEHREAMQPVEYHANVLNEWIDELPYGVLVDMVGDAAGQQRSNVDLASVFDHYEEYGIYWTPSTKKLEDSIMKLFSYFATGNLKIMDNCVELIEELGDYRYPERKLDDTTRNESYYERPIAQNDHLIDALRYVVAEMPDDPLSLKNESYNAQYEINRASLSKTSLPHALQDDREDYGSYGKDAWMSY